MAQKPSVSGLMTDSHEVKRFKNLFYKNVNSSYYNALFGLDWGFWLRSDFEFPLESLYSYIIQESARLGIVLEKIDGDIVNFTLQMSVIIEGIEVSTKQGIS